MDNSTTMDCGDLSEGSRVKTCVDCGTSKTPLWRGGPSGPKSLCNACGIRSRKKRRALLGLNKGSGEEKKSKKSGSSMNNNGQKSIDSVRNKYGEDPLKRKLLALGSGVSWQRSRSTTVDKLRRKLGEVEQAAVLLMALSCGSVYA